jgi:magnesium chelatase family protein
LFDRIDIHIEVPGVRFGDLASKRVGESSKIIRDRVIRAREVQARRFSGRGGIYCNADMTAEEIKEHCRIDEGGMELLKTAMNRLGLSARAYDRILKVSRTIADLGGSEKIQMGHLGEAIQYRSLDRNLLAK